MKKKKQSNLQPNTIGSRKCEVILNKILMDHDDAYLTKRVMMRYNRFKDGCEQIEKLDILRWKKTFLIMWYRTTIAELIVDKNLFPEEVYNFLRNCITAHFRTIIRKCNNIAIKKYEIN